MTAKELHDKLTRPRAEPLPVREPKHMLADLYWHHMVTAPTDELMQHWKQKYEEAKGRK